MVPREELAGRFEGALFATIIRRLAWRPGLFVTTADLVLAVWGDDPDGGPLDAEKRIQHAVYQNRERLEPLGWRIFTGRGGSGGYRLELADAGRANSGGKIGPLNDRPEHGTVAL